MLANKKRKSPKTMSIFELFGEDLRVWKRMGFLGSGSSPADSLTFAEALKLTWNYAPVRATFLYRLSHWCQRQRIRVIPGILWRMNIRRFGLDIVPSVSIGPGLYIPHTVGTVVMARGMGRNVSLIS